MTGALTPSVEPGLPFLLKLLAADSPLSLQTHRSMAQAQAGFDAEEAARNSHHGGLPQLQGPVSQTRDGLRTEPFRGPLRFPARTSETVRFLDELSAPELAAIRATLVTTQVAGGLRQVVTTLLSADRATVAPGVEAVAAQARTGSKMTVHSSRSLPWPFAWPINIPVILTS